MDVLLLLLLRLLSLLLLLLLLLTPCLLVWNAWRLKSYNSIPSRKDKLAGILVEQGLAEWMSVLPE
jgi:hypothetical protein